MVRGDKAEDGCTGRSALGKDYCFIRSLRKLGVPKYQSQRARPRGKMTFIEVGGREQICCSRVTHLLDSAPWNRSMIQFDNMVKTEIWEAFSTLLLPSGKNQSFELRANATPYKCYHKRCKSTEKNNQGEGLGGFGNSRGHEAAHLFYHIHLAEPGKQGLDHLEKSSDNDRMKG